MEGLIEYCATEGQREIIRAVIKYGNPTKAAKALGVDERNARAKFLKIKQRAAAAGFAPECGLTQPIPAGHKFDALSKQTKDEFGNLVWIKSSMDKKQQEEALREVMDAFASTLPKAKAVKAGKGQKYLKDIINQYTITDFHLGMKAWDKECGDDWDTDIAEEMLVAWFAEAIRLAPNSEKAILCQLGDFLHWDGVDPVTHSGNLLDVDTRFQRLIRVTIRVIRKVIDMLLKKHKHVHIIMAEGNHDQQSSMWLREWLAAFYDNEPRITVDDSAIPYYCYEFGLTSLFYHHGHKRKIAKVDEVFAALFREVFGRTKFSYGHGGHLHTIQVIESNLMIVKQHPTLASRDAYASRGGWLSARNATVITYHREYGQVGEITISPDMIR